MELSLYINKKVEIPTLGKIPLYAVAVISIFVLAVLQDYIYSRIKSTGFYWSESMLYNTFWICLIPLTVLINQIVKFINPKIKWIKLAFNLGIGLLFSILHIIIFTSLFVLVSHLVFTPSHRFSSIFNTALSNQFYLVLMWYLIFPIINFPKRKQAQNTTLYPKHINLKIGSKIISVPTVSIQLITTDKPYSIVYANGQKLLDNKTLKEFESELDPTIFFRVHRSYIINSTFVRQLKSRQNGDYNAQLENGQIIRFSRHYRTNWNHLLQ